MRLCLPWPYGAWLCEDDLCVYGLWIHHPWMVVTRKIWEVTWDKEMVRCASQVAVRCA
ncbi:hypothetical protein HU200_043127 [Digitaria exilis]|uniref:Uncharacterized protein n=1 Tax=Digitaria exilis TaxID=1010633 RepID=A0A835B4A3_9POAL|nr:hypothetical protein HU200_043127 [Digitaria exilis]